MVLSLYEKSWKFDEVDFFISNLLTSKEKKPYIETSMINATVISDQNKVKYFCSSSDPDTELVRHFLIESTSKGVRLKGCNNEPVFGKRSH